MNRNLQALGSCFTVKGETTNNKHEKLPTAQDLGSLIVQHVQAFADILKAGVSLPAGHAWLDSDDSLSWWMDCPVKSSKAGVSLFINRIPLPGVSGGELCGDRATICAEIRLFMPETKYREGRTVHKYREYSGERFSAHLWVKTGPHWAFQSTSHLIDKEPFVYADTLEALCADIVLRMNTALARAVGWIAQQNVETAEEACA